MLFQSVTVVTKKLPVDDKITACVKQLCLAKHFLSKFKFCSSSNLLLFYELLIGPQPIFLECIVIFL